MSSTPPTMVESTQDVTGVSAPSPCSARYPSWEPDYRRRYVAGRRARTRILARESYQRRRGAILRSNTERYRTDSQFREDAKKRAREYRLKNYETVTLKRAEYRARNREQLAAKQLARYYTNHESHKSKNAARREKNRLENRRISIARSARLTDGYVREQLSKYSPLSTHEWPAEIVESKKLQLQIKRELKRNETVRH